MTAGHGDAWNYGYKFFKTAIDALQTQYKYNALAVATGIGLLFSKDKNALQNFMKDKK